MALTDRRKTAKNLVDSHENRKILAVRRSRKQGKKELTVKESGTHLWLRFYFPATLTPYARKANRLALRF